MSNKVPFSSGWDGGATPSLMTMGDKGSYTPPPPIYGTLFPTTFSFSSIKKSKVNWTITNIHTKDITFEFCWTDQKGAQSCRFSQVQGNIEPNKSVNGTMSSIGIADGEEVHTGVLRILETQPESASKASNLRHDHINFTVIRTSYNNSSSSVGAGPVLIPANLSTSTVSSASLGSSVDYSPLILPNPATSPPTNPVVASTVNAPVGSATNSPANRNTVDKNSPKPSTNNSPSNSEHRSLDFTFFVLYAISLSFVLGLYNINAINWLFHPVLVSVWSFTFGALTATYIGPFRQWISSLIEKESYSAQQQKKIK